jgi:hypothetical protein
MPVRLEPRDCRGGGRGSRLPPELALGVLGWRRRKMSSISATSSRWCSSVGKCTRHSSTYTSAHRPSGPDAPPLGPQHGLAQDPAGIAGGPGPPSGLPDRRLDPLGSRGRRSAPDSRRASAVRRLPADRRAPRCTRPGPAAYGSLPPSSAGPKPAPAAGDNCWPDRAWSRRTNHACRRAAHPCAGAARARGALWRVEAPVVRVVADATRPV